MRRWGLGGGVLWIFVFFLEFFLVLAEILDVGGVWRDDGGDET